MRTTRARTLTVITAVAAAGIVAGVTLDRTLFAQQPGITRTVLGRADVPPGPQYEGVMALVEIAPGAGSGRHRHPGVEYAYVLEGSVSVKYEDGTTKTFKPGDAMQNRGIHVATNPGSTPVKLLGVFVVEKGKPMAEPVP